MRIELPRCDLKTCRNYSDGNCISKDIYNKCSYADLKDWKEEMDRPVKDLMDAAIMLCMSFALKEDGRNCENCPVSIFDYDKRTEYEKCCLHEPCQNSLYKWLRDKAFEEVFEDILDKFINTPEVYPISAEDLKKALERSNNKYSLKRLNDELN